MDTTQTVAHRNLRIKPLAWLLLPLAIGDVACTSVFAATLPVTNCNDAGSGSLRAALAIAHSGDSVNLTGLTCNTISLATGELLVPVDDLTLQGPGANALTIAGSQVDHSYPVLLHTGHGTLRIDALRVTDNHSRYEFAPSKRACLVSYNGSVYLGRSTVTACSQGAVFSAKGFSARDSTISDSYQGVSAEDGNVSINGSTISGNLGYGCVGLSLGRLDTSATTEATALISNSTISGNALIWDYGRAAAGCIFQSVTISNSTFAFNRAANTGGLYILATEASIESSIFANNAATAPSGSQYDLYVPFGVHISGHDNLFMKASPVTVPLDIITSKTDPLLLPLADNGGPTQTHALAGGSPAIDAGNNLAGLATDQRGFARIAGARPDIGAFESNAAASTSGSIGPGFTGSWFDPAQSGHGLMLEVLSDNRLLAMWFAFNPEGNQQAWFGGVGTYSGNTAIITDVALPTGGRWIPNFDPNAIVRNPWGTLTFTFSDCNHGKVDFNSVRGYGSGSMNLLRLTQPAGLICP